MQKLETLVERLDVRTHGGEFATSVAGVVDHSEQVKQGVLFIARSGVRRDGAVFIEDAISKGAVGIVCTPETGYSLRGRGFAIIETYDPASIGAIIAERFHGNPSSQLKLIGVTGTNGKTTVAWLIRHILNEAKMQCGMLGTIMFDDGVSTHRSTLTTPSFCDTSSILRCMVDHGCVAAVMECSSHALDQGRTSALRFEIGVFTNLSGDHLDYHGSSDAYLRAKMRLFDNVENSSIINMDDPASWAVADRSRAKVISCRTDSDAASVWVEIIKERLDGSTIRIHGDWGTAEIEFPLIGRHNAINALQAAAVAYQLDIPIDNIAFALESTTSPPGRLERVDACEPTVFVDFAHTDDALEQMLWSVRHVLPEGGKLHVVFGCGGDRDKSKRPRMGRVASTIGDIAYVTSDNPRSENPQCILDDILAGVPKDRLSRVHRIVDRKIAIQTAIGAAKENDVVVIAGKGHERNQILLDTVIPFDDVYIAAHAVQKRQKDVSV